MLVVAGCRSHTPVCDGADCKATGSGAADGVAGAGSTPDNAAGAGGAAAREPECTSDSDCTRGTACDGVERCVEGRCQDGQAPRCDHGTECDPNSIDGACVYTEQSPWLLITFDERVVGLPRHLLGSMPLATLAESRDKKLSPFYLATWSPSGADALVITQEPEQGLSLARLQFGSGLPAPLAPFENLPDWFPTAEVGTTFASDGSRMAVDEWTQGSLFIVDLEDPPLPTQLAESNISGFCEDPKTWLSPRGLASIVNGKVAVQEPGGVLSPDARWLAQIGPDAALVPCTIGAERLPLGFGANLFFSPDAHFLAAELDDGSLRVFSLRDSTQPAEVWTHPQAKFRNFSGDSASMLLQPAGFERLSFVDLTADEPATAELELDPSAYVELIGPGALLALDLGSGEETLMWQPFRALQAPMPVAKGVIVQSDAARGMAVVRRDSGEKLENTVLVRFDRDGFRLDSLAQVDAGSEDHSTFLAPDGSGVVQMYERDLLTLIDWFPIDPKTGDLLSKVPLAEGAHAMEFQPWR